MKDTRRTSGAAWHISGKFFVKASNRRWEGQHPLLLLLVHADQCQDLNGVHMFQQTSHNVEVIILYT